MISVIIPAYNAEKTIEKCLDSVLNQSCKDIQPIVVNDGSNDSTPEILKRYAEKDSRVAVMNIPNGGVSHARNTGLTLVKGEYVFFVDSDDYISGDTLETLLKDITDNNADLAVCSAVDEGGTAASLSVFDINTDFFADTEEEIGRNMLYLRLGNVWGKLYRTSIIRDNGMSFHEDISIGEDLIFVHEYMLQCRSVVKDGKAKYFVRNVNEESLSKKYVPNSLDSVIQRNEAIKNAFDRYPGYRSEWDKHFLDPDISGHIWFIQNLSLKGSPYRFSQKLAIARDYLKTSGCARAAEELPDARGPKNWTDKIYFAFLKINSPLLLVTLFEVKEMARGFRVKKNRQEINGRTGN